MDVLGAKLLSMAVLGIVSIICGLAPIFVKRWCLKPNDDDDDGDNVEKTEKKTEKSGLFISGITCFGGGVILTTSLTHMLPEVNILLRNNIKHGQFPDTELPMAEILMLCGFFMIYMVEEFTHALVDKCHKKKDVPMDCHKTHLDFDKHGHHNSEESSPIYVPNGVKKQHSVISETRRKREEEEAASETYFQAALRGFLVVLALSLHEIFEGVALGLFSEQSSVWFLFLAISFHKYVISFCLGMQFVSNGIKTWLVVLYVSTFSLVTVVGAGIGIALSESVSSSESTMQSPLVTILQGLATGTLLYVVFFEVLEKERQSGTNGIYQMGFVILGFLAMVLFELIVINEMPKSVTEEVAQILDLKPTSCALSSIPENFALPMNFTCNVDGYLVPVV